MIDPRSGSVFLVVFACVALVGCASEVNVASEPASSSSTGGGSAATSGAGAPAPSNGGGDAGGGGFDPGSGSCAAFVDGFVEVAGDGSDQTYVEGTSGAVFHPKGGSSKHLLVEGCGESQCAGETIDIDINLTELDTAHSFGAVVLYRSPLDTEYHGDQAEVTLEIFGEVGEPIVGGFEAEVWAGRLTLAISGSFRVCREPDWLGV